MFARPPRVLRSSTGADGKQTNWGREKWHLLRTEAGWKIISVIWSVHDPVGDR